MVVEADSVVVRLWSLVLARLSKPLPALPRLHPFTGNRGLSFRNTEFTWIPLVVAVRLLVSKAEADSSILRRRSRLALPSTPQA